MIYYDILRYIMIYYDGRKDDCSRIPQDQKYIYIYINMQHMRCLRLSETRHDKMMLNVRGSWKSYTRTQRSSVNKGSQLKDEVAGVD